MSQIQAKPHYEILDGLRGVAALMVIVYHVFECFDASPVPHGYLAVDFFFVLSGFVIGYAYDSRWAQGLTVGGFFKRRLIRLHPMVLVGAVLGAITFLLQGSVKWDGTPVSVEWVMLALLLAMFMLPAFPGTSVDVRGNNEMFSLNGPSWSLFFEYIGNIFYALLLRKLPTKILTAITLVTGLVLLKVTVTCGYLGVGWSISDNGFWYGLVRMLFPYTMGMLIARTFRPLKARHTFWWCGLVVILVGITPTLGGEDATWVNGLYDGLCVLILFPALVWLGASEMHAAPSTSGLCKFLGDLSYPLYAIHYPFMYLFYYRIGFDGNLVPISVLHEVWPWAVALVVGCPLLAWFFLRYYDQPVRKWLSRK